MPRARRNDLYRWERLPNGLCVVLRPMPQVESASVAVWVCAGGRYERPELSGVSHFLEHLLFKGTRRYSCEALKRAVEGVGGSLNGFTAEEFTCYMAKVPANYLGRAIGVLGDMALRPTLRPRDVRKEREVILEEIRMYDDLPSQYVHDLFNQLLWPDHPLGSLLSGTRETVTRIDRTALRDYWQRMYQPRNMLVSVAGAVEPERVLRDLRHAFSGTGRARLPRFSRAPRPRQGPQVRILNKKTEQAHLCLGMPAVARTHPYRFALELLHVLLGGNMSSRLFDEVREKRGLAYEIGTQIKRYHDTGAFVVYAGCDTGKLHETVRTIVEQLRRLRREPVPPRELSRAKEFYRGQLVMNLEDTMEQMLWVGEQAVTIGRVWDPKDLVAAIDRVTPAQIKELAQLLFLSRRMYLAAIGPVDAPSAAALRQACIL